MLEGDVWWRSMVLLFEWNIWRNHSSCAIQEITDLIWEWHHLICNYLSSWWHGVNSRWIAATFDDDAFVWQTCFPDYGMVFGSLNVFEYAPSCEDSTQYLSASICSCNSLCDIIATVKLTKFGSLLKHSYLLSYEVLSWCRWQMVVLV